jgi:hypothetical protein
MKKTRCIPLIRARVSRLVERPAGAALLHTGPSVLVLGYVRDVRPRELAQQGVTVSRVILVDDSPGLELIREDHSREGWTVQNTLFGPEGGCDCCALQGNWDILLVQGASGSVEEISTAARRILELVGSSVICGELWIVPPENDQQNERRFSEFGTRTSHEEGSAVDLN